LEAAARELRYGFFRSLLGSDEVDEIEPAFPQGLKPESSGQLDGTAEAVPLPSPTPPHILDKVVTGHTLDDQAETVLMRLIRGTGLRGLGGIYPRILVEREDEDGHGEIVRPLLGIRRRELEQYLVDLKQPWREDSTNADSKFTRNRVRRLVLPLLEREFNPAVVESFSELAEIARDEEDYWENEISGWLGTVVQWSQPEWTRGLPGFEGSQALVQIQASQSALSPELLERLEQAGPAIMNASVSRPWLLTEPRAVQRRVVKAIGEEAGIPLEFKHVEEILRFAGEEGPAGKELSLPLGWKIRREPEAVVFVTPDLRRQERIPDYEYALAVPGRALVAELGVVIEALLVTPRVTPEMAPEARVAEYNPQELLRAELLPGRLTVRNWRPGDRFWPAHTKSPKKIKELLQERYVAQPGRRLWPVAVSGDEIVWMRGFPVPARLRAEAGQGAVLIRETPWAVEEQAI
jgi:tRNA(Ile)-lysidine synthase